MKIRAISAALAVAILAASTSAQAAGAAQASLASVSGDVLINQGQGFKPATPGMALHAGDRVIVTTKGHAKLLYAGGCGVSLAPGSMATVSTLAPCKVGLHRAGVIAGQTDNPPPPPRDSGSPPYDTPFGLAPGTLTLLTVGIFTIGAAGLSGAFKIP